MAIAGVTTGQYGAIWAQQDLRRILGIVGARVVDGDLPVSRAQDVFDDSGELRASSSPNACAHHLAALVVEARPYCRSLNHGDERRSPRRGREADAFRDCATGIRR